MPPGTWTAKGQQYVSSNKASSSDKPSGRLNIGQEANKAWAAAVPLVASWVLSHWGIQVPPEVQGAITVILVWAVPNR